MFSAPPTETSETAIPTLLGRPALHRARQAGDDRAAGSCGLWWKPFVTLIWAGGALVAIGGFLALIGRLLRERGASRRRGGAAHEDAG